MAYIKSKILIIFLIIFVFVTGTGLFAYRNYIGNKAKSLPLNKPAFIPEIVPNTAFRPSQIRHVFVIVEENHDWESIYNNPEAPYINNVLLKKGAHANNYHNLPENMAALHPSEPSYIILEAGTNIFNDHTFVTDEPPGEENSTATTEHLSTLLEKSGYSWKSYQEDIQGDNCPIDAVDNYVPRHNPFLFFQDVSGNPPSTDNKYCRDHVRPLHELSNDLLSGEIPNYTYITPNLQNDMHNGTIAEADTWLSRIIPEILNSPVYKKDGALFITWDEGEQDGNIPIGMIIESPFAKKNYSNDISYSHASFVKTMEDIFNLKPYLGTANDPSTNSLFDFFN